MSDKDTILQIELTGASGLSERELLYSQTRPKFEDAKRLIKNKDTTPAELVECLESRYQTVKRESHTSNYNSPQDTNATNESIQTSNALVLFNCTDRRELLQEAIDAKRFDFASVIFKHEIDEVSAKFNSSFLNAKLLEALISESSEQANAILKLNALLTTLEDFRKTRRNADATAIHAAKIPVIEALLKQTGANKDADLTQRFTAIKTKFTPSPVTPQVTPAPIPTAPQKSQGQQAQVTPTPIRTTSQKSQGQQSQSTELYSLRAKLIAQQKIYEDRIKIGKHYHGLFFGSFHFGKGYSAAEKLKETSAMLQEVNRLIRKLQNPEAPSNSTWSPGKAASSDGILFDSTLKKLYEDLIRFGGEDSNKTSARKLTK